MLDKRFYWAVAAAVAVVAILAEVQSHRRYEPPVSFLSDNPYDAYPRH